MYLFVPFNFLQSARMCYLPPPYSLSLSLSLLTLSSLYLCGQQSLQPIWHWLTRPTLSEGRSIVTNAAHGSYIKRIRYGCWQTIYKHTSTPPLFLRNLKYLLICGYLVSELNKTSIFPPMWSLCSLCSGGPEPGDWQRDRDWGRIGHHQLQSEE